MITHLKVLLQARHLQTHGAFCREYDKIAKGVDASLVGQWPSRATLHRWMAGTVKRMPYPDHCRILEAMFPGWTSEQLLQEYDTTQTSEANRSEFGRLVNSLRRGLANPDRSLATWRVAPSNSSETDLGTLTLPPRLSEGMPIQDDVAHRLGRKLVALQRALRLDDEEIQHLAELSGQVVDLSIIVTITIAADGNSVVTYTHEILNLTSTPLRRVARELWFKHTKGPLAISAIPLDSRKLMIQHLHDVPNLSKFACQLAPPVEPGELGPLRLQLHRRTVCG